MFITIKEQPLKEHSGRTWHSVYAGNPRLSGLAWAGYEKHGRGIVVALFEKGIVHGGFVPIAQLEPCIQSLDMEPFNQQELAAVLTTQAADYNPETSMILLSLFTKGNILAGYVEFGGAVPRENWTEFREAIARSTTHRWGNLQLISLGRYEIEIPSFAIC